MWDGLTGSMTQGESVGIGDRVLQEIGDHGGMLWDMLPDKAGGRQEHVVRIAYGRRLQGVDCSCSINCPLMFGFFMGERWVNRVTPSMTQQHTPRLRGPAQRA